MLNTSKTLPARKRKKNLTPMKMIANIVTISRIVASVAMMLFTLGTPAFWVLYAWCGLSDVADGAIARRLGAQSTAGAVLDSIADLIFVAVCLVKLLPAFPFPLWLIVWLVLIALCKVAGYVYGFASQKRLVALHTPANKIAGVLVFLGVPAVLATGYTALAIPACIVASFATIQENYCIRFHRMTG